MSTVAYITALTIGVFAVFAHSARAEEVPVAQPAPVVVTVVDPLVKYKGATELTNDELIELLSAVGFKGKALRIAWAVTMKESRGHPTSHNKNSSTGDNSYGLFQINMLGSLGEIRRDKFGIKTNAELIDPVTNAKAAYYMTNGGLDWGSWGLGPNAYDGTAAEPLITQWMQKYPA